MCLPHYQRRIGVPKQRARRIDGPSRTGSARERRPAEPPLARRRSARRAARPGADRRRRRRRRIARSNATASSPAPTSARASSRSCTELVDAKDAEVVIFDNDLSPAQVRNLEKATKAKVIDRSELILDIFATRARTIESRLQVELAQLEYALPRLRTMWTHLSRYKGGIGLRGPGETQLEEDRRLVGLKIRDLKIALSARAVPQAARGAQPLRGAHRLAGRLHQRRQEHADEHAHRQRRLSSRTSSSRRSTRAPGNGGCPTGAASCSATRSASSAICRTIWSRRSRRRSRKPARPGCCCTSSMPAIPHAEEQIQSPSTRCSRSLARRYEADAAGAQQDRPREGPVVPAGAADAPSARGRRQRRDRAGPRRAARRGHRDAQRRLRRCRSTWTRAMAGCWRIWRPTRRSIGRSSTTTTACCSLLPAAASGAAHPGAGRADPAAG